MSNKLNSEYSKIGEHLIIKKTPAVTMVAACSNAETGVGPSIASGNHVCKNNWADFAKAAIKKQKLIKSIILMLKYPTDIVVFDKRGIKLKITLKSTEEVK